MDDSTSSKQAFRLRMMRESRIDQICSSFGLALYAAAGIAPWWTPLVYGTVALTGNAVFTWLVRSNRNLRLADPSLFALQWAFAWAALFAQSLITPQLTAMALVGIFTLWHFGAVWFSPRQVPIGYALTAVVIGASFALRWDQLALPAASAQEVILLWAYVMLMIGRFTVLGSQVRDLRRALADRGRQLELLLQRVEELTLARAREEQALALAEERQRIMRDIHDGIGANLITSLALINRQEMSTQAVSAVLRDCVDDLKLTVDSLEPLEGDLLSLLASLRFRLEKRLAVLGITLEWQMQPLPPLPWLQPTQALSIVRVVQEALANVIDHADASRVTMQSCEQTRNERPGIELRITDDGVGMDCSVAVAGKGLRNMQARAQEMGGEMALLSRPGHTEVILWLPLQPAGSP